MNHKLDNKEAPIVLLIRAASEGAVEDVQALIAAGADVNATNPGGQTALMHAALMGDLEIVSLLLQAGADAQLKDRLGLTAGEWSIRRGFPEVSELIANASPPPTRPKSKSATAAAAAEPEIKPVISQELDPEEWGSTSKVTRKIHAHSGTEISLESQAVPAAPQVTLEPISENAPEPDDLTIRSSLAGPETVAAPDYESDILDLQFEPLALEQPLTFSDPTEPYVLSLDLPDPEPDLVTSAILEPISEEVRQNKADAMLTQASDFAPTTDFTIPKLREPAVLSTNNIAEPNPERARREPALKGRVPAFQASPLGLFDKTTSSDSTDAVNLKRCPTCNTVYQNTPLLYCPKDYEALIGSEVQGISASSYAGRSLLLVLVALALSAGIFAAYRLNTYFLENQTASPATATRTQPAPAPPPVPAPEKPYFLIGGALAGMELNIPQPDYPVEIQKAGIAGPVTINIRVNKKGRVVYAASASGDWKLRRAAVKAARQATFSPEKLAQVAPQRGLVSGSITYEFAATATASPSPAASLSPSVSPPPADQSGTTTSTGTESVTTGTDAGPKLPEVGGPLTGAALTLPAAKYPERAKRAGIGGTITVTVRVNRQGRVISWLTSKGDSQLRAAALKAAKNATFSPEKLPGTGEVVGTITYNFTP